MIVLASGSQARAQMLRDAGVAFRVDTSRVDEQSVKAAMLAEGAPPRDIADKLAELKAMRVSLRNSTELVLAGDQVLVSGGELFDKPADLDGAREQLRALRGKTHELLSAAVIFEAGKPVWRHIGRAQLIMRPFSDTFLEDYLRNEGEGLLSSVGAYKLEGRGAQLFSRVQGDFFTVLGLPLLEVLGFLRARGECIE
ncbi:Maf family protein [Pontivivens insulae]|uniref:Nucleoside triphosphate pyrophosphatase n=1 Tax=Pontivivens insulae TaxID=1639689 RepID=A0A2R8A7P5_9RHOB|nr:Maf family protein [Pontivivens insulae]RED18334.1 septum formation protein [Pontivivens insulae]SPF28232.1 Maf-like protein YceF [Pontivivens insulae]